MLAMCIRLPSEGEEYLDKLTDAHFSSPVARRAHAWLREHLDDPMEGLPREDDELFSYVSDLKLRADEEPASREAMELSFDELDVARIEDQIADPSIEDAARVVLQRERAVRKDRIARAQS